MIRVGTLVVILCFNLYGSARRSANSGLNESFEPSPYYLKKSANLSPYELYPALLSEDNSRPSREPRPGHTLMIIGGILTVGGAIAALAVNSGPVNKDQAQQYSGSSNSNTTNAEAETSRRNTITALSIISTGAGITCLVIGRKKSQTSLNTGQGQNRSAGLFTRQNWHLQSRAPDIALYILKTYNISSARRTATSSSPFIISPWKNNTASSANVLSPLQSVPLATS